MTISAGLNHERCPGKFELRALAEPRFLNLMNIVHGGWIMAMLDTAMGLAAQTTLAAGETCPSHETSVKFVRPIAADSCAMHVTGYVVSRSRNVVTLEGRIKDSRGSIHAHGTSTCLIVRREP